MKVLEENVYWDRLIRERVDDAQRLIKTKRNIQNQYQLRDNYRKTKRSLNGRVNVDFVRENIRSREDRISNQTLYCIKK